MKTVLGVITGIVITVIITYLGYAFYIQPPEANMSSIELEEFYQQLHASAFIIFLFAHAIGTVLGGFIAQAIAKARNLSPAFIVGFFIFVGSVINLFMHTFPVWFSIADLLIIIPVALLGGRFAMRMTYNKQPDPV